MQHIQEYHTLKHHFSFCRKLLSESVPDASAVSIHSHILSKYWSGQIFAYASIWRRLCVGTVVFLNRVITKTSNCELQVF